MVEWNEGKRRLNIDKHGLDLADADLLFDGRPALTVSTYSETEERFLTTAVSEGVFVTLVWTWRGVDRRMISFRRARRGERDAYRQLYG